MIVSVVSVVLLAVFVVPHTPTGGNKTSQVTEIPGRLSRPTTTGSPATQATVIHVGTVPTKTLPTPILTTPSRPSGEYLSIPAIGVNAPVENVGVSADGSLAVPTQNPWTDVGWYQYGPQPGTRGSAVIDGHLDRPGGSPAVFWNLKNLRVGDIATITKADGQFWHFRVIALNYYFPTSAPTSNIFENTTGSFLNLITCAGTWVPSQHQTTLRLVVYTVLV